MRVIFALPIGGPGGPQRICPHCKTPAGFIGMQESILKGCGVEIYSCGCGHTQFEKPVVENKPKPK